MSLWLELDELQLDIASFVEDLEPEQAAEGRMYAAQLKTLIELLQTDSKNLPTAEPVAVLPRCKVQRLGLADELVRLRPQMSVEQLSAKYSLGADTIRRFFKRYDAMKPTERVRARKHSVFDTFERLEELTAMIHRQLAVLQSQPDVHVKYIAELRMTLDLAARLSKDLYTIRKYEDFKKSVVEILLSELPERRQELQQRFALISSTLPSA